MFKRPPVRGLLIVARNQRDVHEAFQYAYGDSETLTVLLDRRQGERRRALQRVPGERRRSDRRRRISIADDLRFQQYVLVHPNDRPPRDSRFARFACLLGLALVVGLGILVAPFGDPVELLESDVVGAARRSAISAIQAIRPVVIDLINAFVRLYL